MTTGVEEVTGGGTRLYGRILIASLTLGSLATAGALWWYYNSQLAAMEEAVVQELTAVSDSKTRQIDNWRKERLGDGHLLMASPHIIRTAESILTGHGNAADSADLLDVLKRMQEAFLYAGAALCEKDGHPRVATPGASTDAARLRDLTGEALRSNVPQLSDLRLEAGTGRPLMALTIPVAEAGAIILDIDPERFLYPYLRTWPGRSKSAETLLIRRDGDDAAYLSDLRHHPGAPLRFHRNLKSLHLPPDSAFDAGPLIRGPDYRGVPVLAVVRHVPDSPWFLSVKIDGAEADAPERRLGWEMAIITALIAMVNIAGVALVWRSQGARIHREREEWFRAIANDTPAYLWMAAPEVENSFINVPLARFLGTSETRLSKAWSEWVHPDDAEGARAIFLESLRTRSEYTDEFRIRRYDGEYRWVVSRAVPRFSAQGRFLGFAGTILDVTGRRSAEQKLREANTSLAAELAESTRKEQEIQDLSARLIDAQEEERKRLARELHDDLSQQIAALSIATGNLKRQIPAEGREASAQSDRIHDKLVHLAEAVRRMSHELHPAMLQYSGLPAALRSYCEEFGTLTRVRISLDVEGSFEGVAPNAALCLFRVTQEALRNVAKHARVSAASVRLQRGGGTLRLIVTDTGAGFAPGDAASKAGLGLLSIQERVRLVCGKVQIRSGPGEGTSIMVQIPE